MSSVILIICESLELLRVFYAEGLVDKKLFLSWLVQQMAVCNLAQAAFVVRLAKEYLDDMMLSQALVRPFIYGCITKLSEVRKARRILIPNQGIDVCRFVRRLLEITSVIPMH